jgi:hypothetical protein
LGGVHEPGFEKALGQRLQRLVHPPVQLNLVVQRTQHRGNGALFGKRRKRNLQAIQCFKIDIILNASGSFMLNVPPEMTKHILNEKHFAL